MIKTENLVPEVYYKRSRDFQTLGRTYDIIFNYLKTSNDLIKEQPLSDNSNKQFIDLLCTTLGISFNKNYNIKQLNTLCSIYMIILKNKGNLNSIQYILNVLSNVEDINEQCEVQINKDNPYRLDLYVPSAIEDITLLNEVLNYILPAGMSYRIVRQKAIKVPLINDIYTSSSEVKSNVIYNSDLGRLRSGEELAAIDSSKLSQSVPAMVIGADVKTENLFSVKDDLEIEEEENE